MVELAEKHSPYLLKSVAEEYDNDRFSGSFGRYLHDQEVQLYLQMLEDSKGPILDAGVGSGKLTIVLLKKHYTVKSIDFSKAMIDVAQSKIRSEGLQGNLEVCDIHHLYCADRAFESVVCSRVLMHLRNWKLALFELCRVTQKTVVIDFPSRLSFAFLDSFMKRIGQSLYGTVQAYSIFTLKEIQREFEKNHFKIAEVKTGYFLPVAFHRWIDDPNRSLRLEKIFSRIGLVNRFGSPVTVKAVRK